MILWTQKPFAELDMDLIDLRVFPLHRRFDRHVVPTWQPHACAPDCWCGPVLDREDPITGGRVFIHTDECEPGN